MRINILNPSIKYLIISIFSCIYVSGALYAQTQVFQTQLNGSSFSITRNSQDQSYNIEIGTAEKIEVLDIVDLSNPSRLVIDLKDLSTGKNAVFTIKNDLLFSQLRIGKHSDKIRLVFDLRSQSVPEYTWERINNTTIKVFLNPVSDLAQNAGSALENPILEAQTVVAPVKAQQLEAQQILPQENAETLEANKEMPLAIEQTAMSKADTVTPAPLAKADAAQKIEQQNTNQQEQGRENILDDDNLAPQGLENIKFYYQKEKNTPLVRFILVKKPEYSIKKESDKRYMLTIPEASIRWPHLELPQFPPRDFRGFTMVMPEKSGSDLNIAIGVERGSSISSFTKNNEIWLKIN